ncbi:MAG: type III-B CRISPR-associated protein Cas10/Cmr2 [Anaeromyxobacteraceae bacterium]|nr:type III-B CRISPR-associated protein Cas10/Cmr2 [Anaeromyxobacteraceae bacterium]
MTTHLLLLAIGPVQEFIAQARRTRDLWFGSHVLSELSKAAAKACAAHGALVFPALDAASPELQERDEPTDTRGEPAFSVANKVLVELQAGVSPADVAHAARAAAGDRLTRIAASVWQKNGSTVEPTAEHAFQEQVATFLEFAAVWAPVEGQDGYAATRQKLERMLAGRKGLREFGRWRQQRGGVPKSSLDGGRETVLKRHAGPDTRLRLSTGEQLDAIGLIKRAGGRPDQFVPVANVAAAAWTVRNARALAGFAQECEAERGRLGRIFRDFPWVEAFPYDVQLLRPERWTAIEAETGLAPGWCKAKAGPLFAEKRIAPPPSYVACLVADGDRMGVAIDDPRMTADAHRRLSRALADFARQARAVVETQHRGLLIYAGGDDVLALLCLEDALACAGALNEAFTKCIAAGAPDWMTSRPTLSVGIGIGHVLENLGDLVELGRQAERHAKVDRNSLAVLVDKRSGGLTAWRAMWPEGPLDQVKTAKAALRDRKISKGKVYETRDLLSRMPEPSGPLPAPGPPRSACPAPHPAGPPCPFLDLDQGWSAVLARDVWRTLKRMGSGPSPAQPADVGLALDLTGKRPYAEQHRQVGEWVCLILVARMLEAS